ncbi:hypothetical protein [Oceanivirga miroungae]|uniref:DUF3575 domain-containing protein n=1 Tax=Oceanivirga miroungae TaxID=1130046 RepID=A0A6I8MD78_9FUSO|nr:hypothetical protein [Oceanivirga miroungae]VWL85050.1 hypothetical protein OMES3154_00326 [Oceanivirga miroungae]
MKKYLSIIFLFFSFSSLAWEVDGIISYKPYDKFTLSVEAIPYNKGTFEFGLGTVYEYPNKFIPLYFVNKTNLYRSNDNIKEKTIYILDKFGIGVDNKKMSINYSLGLGFHYKVFLLEISYDGSYIKSTKEYKNGINFGIGMRIGDFINQTKKTLVQREDIDFKK